MAAHSNILAWKIPWTEEPWVTVHKVTKESDTTEKLLHTHTAENPETSLIPFIL